MSVTKEQVEWAYRLFLEREPESEDAIKWHMQNSPDFSALRETFLTCAEFKALLDEIEKKQYSDETEFRYFDNRPSKITEHLSKLGDEYREGIVYNFYRHVVKKKDIVLDIGANYGLHTFNLSKLVGINGKVFAIEALPFLAEHLRELSTNTNIEIIERAVCKENKPISFNHVVSSNGYSGILKRDLSDLECSDVELINVQGATLDSLLDRNLWHKISFIKMDIEGGEFFALQSGKELIKKARPVIVFENGMHVAAQLYKYSCNDFLSFFNGIKYDVFSLVHNDIISEELFFCPLYYEFLALPREHKEYARLKNLIPVVVEDAINKKISVEMVSPLS